MHISEGLLPAAWAAAHVAASVPFLAKGVADIKRHTTQHPETKPLYGLVGAAVFVISALPIPVPIAGTCAHPTGVGMAAILIRPFPATVLTGIVLAFQALLMGHGGVTTWGANVFNMGVLGAFAGYGAYAGMRRAGLPLWSAAAAAGAVSDIATYAGTALSLALALHGDQPVWVVWAAIATAFVPTQLPLAILEALVTAGMVGFIVERRPDIAARIGLAPRPIPEEAQGVA
jgi:cobalt/nickel transport system permease protein